MAMTDHTTTSAQPSDTFDYEGAIARMEAAGITLAAMMDDDGECLGVAIRDWTGGSLSKQVIGRACLLRMGEVLAAQGKVHDPDAGPHLLSDLLARRGCLRPQNGGTYSRAESRPA